MFSRMRKWPIRKQIMTSFMILTIILLVMIFVIIYVNIINTIQTSSDMMGGIVKSLTQKTMQNIIKEKGAIVELDKEILGSNIWILKFLFSEITEYNSLYGYESINSYNYDDLNKSSYNFVNDPENSNYNISYNISSIWKPWYSVDSLEGNYFINMTAQLDRFIVSLFITPMVKTYFKRINYYFISSDNKTQILRSFPAQKIQNPSILLNVSNTDYELYMEYARRIFNTIHSDYPHIIISGPYMDVKTYGKPVCSFNALLVTGGQLKGMLQFELKKDFFDEYTFNLKFLNSGYGLIFNYYGILIGKPQTWKEFSDNMTLSMLQIPNRTDLNFEYWNTLDNAVANNDTLESRKILDYYYNYDEFYESTALLPYNLSDAKFGVWEYGIKLYVKMSEIDSIKKLLQKLMNDNFNLMNFINMLFCIITLSAVVIFTFKVTMSLSKPLKKLIKFANVINNNGSEKKFLKEMRDEITNLPEGEYQLQQLIVAFKDLLGVFNEKSVNKEAKVITKPIFYPLNQYHKDFVEKAKKGITEINWMHVIDQIQNEFNECDEDTRNLNEIWNT